MRDQTQVVTIVVEAKSPPLPVPGLINSIRRSEWVVLAFFVWAACLAVEFPIAAPIRERTVLLNVAILAGYFAVIHRDATRPHLVMSVIRDWLPLPLTLLAYREIGWFALPHASHPLEARWVI